MLWLDSSMMSSLVKYNVFFFSFQFSFSLLRLLPLWFIFAFVLFGFRFYFTIFFLDFILKFTYTWIDDANWRWNLFSHVCIHIACMRVLFDFVNKREKKKIKLSESRASWQRAHVFNKISTVLFSIKKYTTHTLFAFYDLQLNIVENLVTLRMI